jgi:hypothetical protein
MLPKIFKNFLSILFTLSILFLSSNIFSYSTPLNKKTLATSSKLIILQNLFSRIISKENKEEIQNIFKDIITFKSSNPQIAPLIETLEIEYIKEQNIPNLKALQYLLNSSSKSNKEKELELKKWQQQLESKHKAKKARSFIPKKTSSPEMEEKSIKIEPFLNNICLETIHKYAYDTNFQFYDFFSYYEENKENFPSIEKAFNNYIIQDRANLWTIMEKSKSHSSMGLALKAIQILSKKLDENKLKSIYPKLDISTIKITNQIKDKAYFKIEFKTTDNKNIKVETYPVGFIADNTSSTEANQSIFYGHFCTLFKISETDNTKLDSKPKEMITLLDAGLSLSKSCNPYKDPEKETRFSEIIKLSPQDLDIPRLAWLRKSSNHVIDKLRKEIKEQGMVLNTATTYDEKLKIIFIDKPIYYPELIAYQKAGFETLRTRQAIIKHDKHGNISASLTLLLLDKNIILKLPAQEKEIELSFNKFKQLLYKKQITTENTIINLEEIITAFGFKDNPENFINRLHLTIDYRDEYIHKMLHPDFKKVYIENLKKKFSSLTETQKNREIFTTLLSLVEKNQIEISKEFSPEQEKILLEKDLITKNKNKLFLTPCAIDIIKLYNTNKQILLHAYLKRHQQLIPKIYEHILALNNGEFSYEKVEKEIQRMILYNKLSDNLPPKLKLRIKTAIEAINENNLDKTTEIIFDIPLREFLQKDFILTNENIQERLEDFHEATKEIKNIFINLISSDLVKDNPKKREETTFLFAMIFQRLLEQDEEDRKLPFTPHDAMHSIRVTNYTDIILRSSDLINTQLDFKYGPQGIFILKTLTLLHDIGYVGIDIAKNIFEDFKYEKFTIKKSFHADLSAYLTDIELGETIKSLFDLTDDLYIEFINAIKLHGADKKTITTEGLTGTGEHPYTTTDTFNNILLYILRTADNADILFKRLKKWQKNIIFIDILKNIYENAEIKQLSKNKKRLQSLCSTMKDLKRKKTLEIKVSKKQQELDKKLKEIKQEQIELVTQRRSLAKNGISVTLEINDSWYRWVEEHFKITNIEEMQNIAKAYKDLTDKTAERIFDGIKDMHELDYLFFVGQYSIRDFQISETETGLAFDIEALSNVPEELIKFLFKKTKTALESLYISTTLRTSPAIESERSDPIVSIVNTPTTVTPRTTRFIDQSA